MVIVFFRILDFYLKVFSLKCPALISSWSFDFKDISTIH